MDFKKIIIFSKWKTEWKSCKNYEKITPMAKLMPPIQSFNNCHKIQHLKYNFSLLYSNNTDFSLKVKYLQNANP